MSLRLGHAPGGLVTEAVGSQVTISVDASGWSAAGVRYKLVGPCGALGFVESGPQLHALRPSSLRRVEVFDIQLTAVNMDLLELLCSLPLSTVFRCFRSCRLSGLPWQVDTLVLFALESPATAKRFLSDYALTGLPDTGKLVIHFRCPGAQAFNQLCVDHNSLRKVRSLTIIVHPWRLQMHQTKLMILPAPARTREVSSILKREFGLLVDLTLLGCGAGVVTTIVGLDQFDLDKHHMDILKTQLADRVSSFRIQPPAHGSAQVHHAPRSAPRPLFLSHAQYRARVGPDAYAKQTVEGSLA